MERLLVVLVLVAVATGIAALVRRRDGRPVATPASWTVPVALDRDDFERPDAPWLVVVFSSATCLACRGAWAKVEQLASDRVAVQDVEAAARKDLHDRYAVDAVPCVLVVDADGLVRASFLGEPSSADLWATVADLREPGSVPPGCDHGV